MKVLIPFDGSEASQSALHYVLKSAKNHRSLDITILTVVCNEAPFARDFVANPTEALNACQDFFRGSLEKAKALFDAEGIQVSTLMKSGDAAEVIISTVEEQGFDKVIMGRRGLSSLTGWVLGSVSAKVLNNVDVPVTLVK
ncbi:universal stress protein [Desulforamulus aeronauticus]|uniref:Nucleotide-binding universal stress protein, UspA family n=1 Tax=Desulforamulus aeronauticus DSM 10349 TaxID=1121421 RepID=A0A1M6QB19_9FIRM|nr:universal stress protein [Desulforamulus aeronauticus]SHK17330.1 Nucleotide-binding universal stress protein, UspA family [Desulforamulus aeronauticus DSM 10349]